MSYQIVLKKSAQEHIIAHKRSGNVTLCQKIENLLLELAEHPREGTGKPEMLKGDLAGYWSRRINREHRLVYSIDDVPLLFASFLPKGIMSNAPLFGRNHRKHLDRLPQNPYHSDGRSYVKSH